MTTRFVIRFWLMSVVLVALGGLLRLGAGWQPLSWLARVGAPTEAGASVSRGADLVDTVLSFYRLIDDGKYREAYWLSLENKWEKGSDGQLRVIGLVSEEEFVDRLLAEMGVNGLGQNIIKIGVLTQSLLPPGEWTATRWPELHTLAFLDDTVQVQDVYQVQVVGALLGRCSQWDWVKHLLVARLGGAQRWKILLPGSGDTSQPHYQDWFIDR